MMTPTQDLSKEIQPNILRPCSRAYASRMHLFHFDTTEAARSWLREVNARLYEISGASTVWLNVSFTYPGLERLGVDALDLAEFPQAFRDGMARRAAVLGDPSLPSTPERSGDKPTHAALNVLTQVDGALLAQLLAAGEAAQDPKRPGYDAVALRRALAQALDDVCAGELAVITTGVGGERTLVRAHDLHHALVHQIPGDPSSPPTSVEYFGFRDGIAQPKAIIDGQPNPQIVLPAAGRRPGSLLANGTYLVTRQLEQNVGELWKHMEENYQSANLPSALELAELLVGRRRDGLPLDAAPDGAELPRLSATAPPAFTHEPHDEQVAPRCPFQSHVRRMNPQLEPNEATAGTNPRLLRRGMSYAAEDGTVGLMFMAYNADLERQFEFIQSNWIQKGNHAGGLTGHCDPLTSQRLPGCAECKPGQEACDPCKKGRGCQVCHAGTSAAPITFVAARTDAAPLVLKLPDFVTLRWGDYFFVPARSALTRMAGAPPTLRLEAEPPLDASQLEAVLGWINDSKLARTFWTKHVPEHGLRLGKHVFVKEPAVVRTVLSDPRPSHGLSVCEYGRKLRSISGAFVLGMDSDTADYHREIKALAVIPTAYEDNREIAETARTAATDFLRLIAARARGRGSPTVLEAGPLIAFTLSRVWGAHFGIPGPSRASLLMWAQEITDAVFRDGQTDIKMAQAEQAGKELRGYVLDLIVEARADEQNETNPALLARLESFTGNDDDDAARMLTGIVVGGLTAVAGTFVPGLLRFAADQNGGDVAAALRDAPTDEGEGWPLYRALARALEDDQLGGPDYLYRQYNGSAELLFKTAAGAPHESIEPGDTVVSWIGGASRPGDGDEEIRFGAGAHRCPGREMARAVIDGTLAALVQCKTLALTDARGSKLELTLQSAS
jgi:Dyp-type peroxidase family